jgi:2-polyprenyl-3-methyl-5-hydroxy-6-metoxy-1,4-benzoquinol methylase
MLGSEALQILDVGCGAGGNAALMRRTNPAAKLFGITISAEEARVAADHFDKVWVCDVEEGFPEELSRFQLDAIIFSHVLEHLRDPARVVAASTRLLRDGGSIFIAVPNVVNWRERWKLLLGRFEYEQSGTMDETHLRFFTFHTADRYLLSQAPQLKCVEKRADGSVPLWVFRRYLFPKGLSRALDGIGVRNWPNLFGAQVLIAARKHSMQAPAGKP